MLSVSRGRPSFLINSQKSNAFHFLFTSEGKLVEPMEIRGAGLPQFIWRVESGQYFHLEYRKDGRGIFIRELQVDDKGKEELVKQHDVTDIPLEIFIEIIHCNFNKAAKNE